MNAFYMWTDHREKVDALLSAYTRNFLEEYAVLAVGPLDTAVSLFDGYSV